MGTFDDEYQRRPAQTWNLAKPARPFSRLRSLTRSSLVLQMQRFDIDQRLTETIDMDCNGYLASLLPRRHLAQKYAHASQHEAHLPQFMWTRDVHHESARSDRENSDSWDIGADVLSGPTVASLSRPATVSYSTTTPVVTVAMKTGLKTASESPEWRFCAGENCITMVPTTKGDHGVYAKSILAATWKPRRHNQVIQRFDLVRAKGNLIVAHVTKQDLVIYDSNSSWLSDSCTPAVAKGPDMIIVSTAMWLVQQYFKLP